jgi:N-succinyldiaminopimelate aminotransferase
MPRNTPAADEILAGLPGYRPPEAGSSCGCPPEGRRRGGGAEALARGRVQVLPGAYLARDVGGETPARTISAWRWSPRRRDARGLDRLRACLYD